jgi:hypothetical protein
VQDLDWFSGARAGVAREGFAPSLPLPRLSSAMVSNFDGSPVDVAVPSLTRRISAAADGLRGWQLGLLASMVANDSIRTSFVGSSGWSSVSEARAVRAYALQPSATRRRDAYLSAGIHCSGPATLAGLSVLRRHQCHHAGGEHCSSGRQ